MVIIWLLSSRSWCGFLLFPILVAKHSVVSWVVAWLYPYPMSEFSTWKSNWMPMFYFLKWKAWNQAKLKQFSIQNIDQYQYNRFYDTSQEFQANTLPNWLAKAALAFYPNALPNWLARSYLNNTGWWQNKTENELKPP